jgi:hypothetical protein
LGLEVLYLWPYIFGIAGVGIIVDVLLIVSIVLFFLMFFIWMKIGWALPVILRINKKNKCLILLKPYNIWLEGEIIDDIVHFKYGGVDYAYFIHQKDIERIFNGLQFMELYATELVGMHPETVKELNALLEHCTEEELKAYISAVKNYYVGKSLEPYVSEEKRQGYLNYLATLQEQITAFEEKYNYNMKFEPKAKQIGWFVPKWEKIKQYYINGSLSFFHQLAKSYGIAVKNKDKPDYMIIGIVCFMLLMGAALAWKMLSG